MAKVICPMPGYQITVMESHNTRPFTVRWQFMPLYGPQELFDFVPNTLVSECAAHSQTRENK